MSVLSHALIKVTEQQLKTLSLKLKETLTYMMEGTAVQHKTSFVLWIMFDLRSSELLVIYKLQTHLAAFRYSASQILLCVWSLTEGDRIESKMHVTNSKTLLTNTYRTEDEQIIRTIWLLLNTDDLPFKSSHWKVRVMRGPSHHTTDEQFEWTKCSICHTKVSHCVWTPRGQMVHIRPELNESVSEIIYIHSLADGGAGIQRALSKHWWNE